MHLKIVVDHGIGWLQFALKAKSGEPSNLVLVPGCALRERQPTRWGLVGGLEAVAEVAGRQCETLKIKPAEGGHDGMWHWIGTCDADHEIT